MINKSKSYRTRDGREVRIYATDGDSRPVHGAWKTPDGGWKSDSWCGSGLYRQYDNTPMDLIEVRPRIKRVVWVNVYPDHVTVHDAVSTHCPAGGGGRIACVRLTIDVEEGEGL